MLSIWDFYLPDIIGFLQCKWENIGKEKPTKSLQTRATHMLDMIGSLRQNFSLVEFIFLR